MTFSDSKSEIKTSFLSTGEGRFSKDEGWEWLSVDEIHPGRRIVILIQWKQGGKFKQMNDDSLVFVTYI